MSKYLKTIGIVNVIGAIIALIFYVILGISAKLDFFVFMVGFIAIALFAPSLGIALYYFADIREMLEYYIDQNSQDKAENKLVLMKMETKTCVNCGYSMSKKQTSCPKCGARNQD